MPVMCGSAKHKIIDIAIATSTAFAPSFNKSNPNWLDNGCELATIPTFEIACDLLGEIKFRNLNFGNAFIFKL